MPQLNESKAAVTIPVAGLKTNKSAIAVDVNDTWQEKRQELSGYNHARDWVGALTVLTELSTKKQYPDVRKALAQRIWVGLKSDAPAIHVVTALRELVMILGVKHELAGPLAALAHLMAKHRTPDHPDSELAMVQSQQLFHYICEPNGVKGEVAFNKWVEDNNLNNPDHYIPLVTAGLEIMVLDDWWIDRDALQQELIDSNAQKQTP